MRRCPDHVAAHYNRACAFSLQQKPGTILSDLQRALELDPSLAEHARHDPELEWARHELAAVRRLL